MIIGKIKQAFELVEELRTLASSIESLANALKANEAAALKVQTQNEEPVTIEGVRAVLSQKSQAGKQSEVKALIAKYGVNKLTDIDPTLYGGLLKEAEAL